jgi:hypothetical protein
MTIINGKKICMFQEISRFEESVSNFVLILVERLVNMKGRTLLYIRQPVSL